MWTISRAASFITSNEADPLHHPVWLNVGKCKKKNPTNFVVFDFFGCNFRHPLPPHNYRTIEFTIFRLRQTFFKIVNSQKHWTKTQYGEFEGAAIAMWGNWRTKIAAAIAMGEIGWRKSLPKKSNWRLRFFSRDFRHPISPITIAGFAILRLRQTVLRILNSKNCWWGKLVDENHDRKNWKRQFDFFSRDFCQPPPPITIIAGPSNSRYWIFIKHFWEFTHRNIEVEGIAITMWRGGGNENHGKKN